MFTNKTGLIIPTRNRPDSLNATLEFLSKNKINFFKKIVIDSSDTNLKSLIINICDKFKAELYFSKPSISKQRNLGLRKLAKYQLEFIMFLDDDLKFYNNSFKVMNTEIKKYRHKFSGFGFNNIDFKKVSLLEKIKFSKITEKLGLYSSIKGKVLTNGWHTKCQNIKKNIEVQWLTTQCSIFTKSALKKNYFDQSFGVYSYLEDLDFSLKINLKKKNIFLFISGARYIHLNETVRRSFLFGYYEFINRYKIVKRFNLSEKNFFIMAFIKIILTMFSIFINYKNIFKLFGNFISIIKCIMDSKSAK